MAQLGSTPAPSLITRARALDPNGKYLVAGAEDTGLPEGSVDLAVAYLSLIDIRELAPAIRETVRILKPDGTLLSANLHSFVTACEDTIWAEASTSTYFAFDRYQEEHARWRRWHGIAVQNWHRPLTTYFAEFLTTGLRLRHFEEPFPAIAADKEAELFARVPMFVIMEWDKPNPSSS